MNYQIVEIIIDMLINRVATSYIDYRDIDKINHDLSVINKNPKNIIEFKKQLLDRAVEENINIFSYINHYDMFSTSDEVGELNYINNDQEIKISSGKIIHKSYQFFIFRKLISICSCETIEEDNEIRYDELLSVSTKNNVTLTYKEFLYIKNGSFSKGIKEIICNLDTERLLNVNFVDNIRETVVAYNNLKSINLRSHNVRRQFMNYYEVKVSYYYEEAEREISKTIIVMCDSQEYTKLKLMT